MLAPPIPQNEKERLVSLYALNLLETDPEERFDRLTQLTSDVFDVPIAYLSLVDENRQWYLSCSGMSRGETTRQQSFCGHAILGEEALIIPDAMADDRFADNPLVTGPPFVRFYAGQPLRAPDGHKVGTLCLVDRKPRPQGLSDNERNRLITLGRLAERELISGEIARLHTELGDLRKKEKEYLEAVDGMLKLGRRIQHDFLPRDVPERDGWQVSARFSPAMEVSGDFYDAFDMDDGRIALAVGDVAGKGMGAALYMALNRTLLRAFAEQAVRDGALVKVAVPALNDYLVRHHPARGRLFSSLFFGVLDPETGRLGYVNAGHLPPRIIADGTFEQLETTGPAIGLSAAAEFQFAETHIPPGGLLVAFTDGLTEARSESGAEFGDDGLEETLRSLAGLSASEAVERLCESVDCHSNGEIADDLTVLAVSS